MDKGFLLVISGPSGVGKGTVCQEVMNQNKDVLYSVSATTRKKRPMEVDGENYYYYSTDEFQKKIEENNFLEYANVHGNWYGTPKDFVLKGVENGEIIILEIDVQGALQVKKNYPHGVFVFLLPPTLEELKRRIIYRGTEDPSQIDLRLQNAKKEIKYINEYEYAVMNDDISDAVLKINHIIEAEKLRVIHKNYLNQFLEGEVND